MADDAGTMTEPVVWRMHVTCVDVSQPLCRGLAALNGPAVLFQLGLLGALTQRKNRLKFEFESFHGW